MTGPDDKPERDAVAASILAYLPVPEFASIDGALTFTRTCLPGASETFVSDVAMAIYEARMDAAPPPAPPPAPAPSEWVLLSAVLGNNPQNVSEPRIDAEARALMERIADGRLRVRYRNPDDDPTRTSHRYERLPEDFFRSGRVNWKFSAVTFRERTIHQIELFIPFRDGEATADPKPKLGRPTSEDLVKAEANRILDSGEKSPSDSAFAKDVQRRLRRLHPKAKGTSLSAVKRQLKKWGRSGEVVQIKSF